MNRLSQKAMRAWIGLGSRFLPFADAATPDLPLSRLLRLSLFQVSVGMALVLLIGTLNRVMIVELGVPVSLVAIMISLPLIFVQFGGLAIMPFALLVLSGGGNAKNWPLWIGDVGAALAFLLVGAGLHTVQTLSLIH